MGSKKIWFLITIGIAVFLCIVGVLFFLLQEDAPETKDHAISVIKVSYTKVTGMKITQGDSVIDLVKANGIWRYRENADASIDQGSMESALTMVCYLYAKEKLFDHIENPANYGLDPAAMQVEIELDDGTRQQVRFGGYTSARDGVFLQYDQSDALYVYDLDSFSILQNAAKAMSDLTIGIDADNLAKIEIVRASGSRVPITMEKISEGKSVGLESWMLTSPFTAIANAEAVSLVKSFFASPRYSSYAGSNVLPEYGLDGDPAYISLTESSGRSVKIFVGNRLESGRYYCMQEGRSGVYELASGFDALLKIETINLFPTAVFPVSADQTADVTVDLGAETFRLVQNKDKGFLLNGRAIDDETENTLFTYLAQLQYRGVAEQATISGEPDATITLEHGANKLVYSFYGYRNDYYAVELNASGTLGGYIKAEHLSVLAAAFDKAAKE